MRGFVELENGWRRPLLLHGSSRHQSSSAHDSIASMFASMGSRLPFNLHGVMSRLAECGEAVLEQKSYGSPSVPCGAFHN